MKKICLNLCLVIILLLSSIFKSFSQNPQDLVGAWKGKYVEEGLSRLTLDYTLSIERVASEGSDLIIDVKYDNRSDGRKNAHDVFF